MNKRSTIGIITATNDAEDSGETTEIGGADGDSENASNSDIKIADEETITAMLDDSLTDGVADDTLTHVGENSVCHMHWLILILAIAGEIITVLFKKKPKTVITADAADVVLMLILTFFGSCVWDIVVMALGTVAIGITAVLLIRKRQEA